MGNADVGGYHFQSPRQCGKCHEDSQDDAGHPLDRNRHRNIPDRRWGLSWAPFDNGLPNVVINALALNGTGDRLRAAANGYSMWEIPLAASCPQEDIYICDNKLDTGEGCRLK